MDSFHSCSKNTKKVMSKNRSGFCFIKCSTSNVIVDFIVFAGDLEFFLVFNGLH